MAKVKSHKFILSDEDENEFDLIGICSHVSDFKLAWDLNRNLNLELEFSSKLFTIYPKRNQTADFPYYFQDDEENYLSIYLIKNKYNGHTLIPELHQIDYFLFFVNNQIHDIEKLNNKIRNLEASIFASYIIDTTKYASIDNIIFD